MTDSDLIANDDPVKVERARSLLRSAAKAVDAFEEAIRELVSMRAWVVLGYEDLAAMWDAETGFKCPTYAKVLAVQALEREGLNTARGFGADRKPVPSNGHTNLSIAKQVGLPVYAKGAKGSSSPVVTQVRRQLDHGVPADKVLLGDAYSANRRIDEHGTRARGKPRRLGKGPDESVQAVIYLPRRNDDAISEMARKADVPKAEIYRQAVAEYLQRHNVSTHFGHAPNGASPEVSEASK